MSGPGGAPPPYGPPVYGQPVYGQDPYAPPGYGQAPYGQAPNGQAPYGHQPGHGWGAPQAWQPVAPPPPPDPRWSFPHPEPRPYHLMLRTWTYRTWKPIVGIVMVVVGLVIVLPLLTFPVLLIAALFEPGDMSYGERILQAATMEKLTPSGLLYLNVALGAMILWVGLVMRVLHHLRLRWSSSVVPKLRWGFMAGCAGMAFVALVAQVVVGALVPQSANPDVAGQANALTGTTIALAVIVLLTTPFQAAGEEYAFRGYLLQAIGALARHRWISIVLTALLFACAHLQFDPPLFFDRFMFGLIAAWLVIRTGGLEAGIALHVLNNYLAFGFAIAFSDLDTALDPGEISWWNIPVTLTQSLVYAVLVLWLAKRSKVQRTTRPPDLDEPVEAPAGTVSGPAV